MFETIRTWVTKFAPAAIAGLALVAAQPAGAVTIVTLPPGYSDYDILTNLNLSAGSYRLTLKSNQPLTWLDLGYYQEVEDHADADQGYAGWQHFYYTDGQISQSEFFNGFTIRFDVYPDEEYHYDCCMPDTTKPELEFTGYHQRFTYTPILYASMSWEPSSEPITIRYWISAVPEPATWTMMILGFGFAGASLRRQRVLVANRTA